MISQFRIHINLLNSLFITLSTIALITVVGVLAAYVFAKRPFPGSKGVFLAIILTMFMPNQVTLIPLYFQFSRMGLVNTPYSVILCFLAAGIPSCIMLLTDRKSTRLNSSH